MSTTDVRVRTGCNHSGPTFSGLDNCDGVFAPSVADGGKTLTSGNSEWAYSQTWTATYTDACLNASCTSIHYHMERRLRVPVISTTDVSADLGCNQQWLLRLSMD
jgi:hypothetical protein